MEAFKVFLKDLGKAAAVFLVGFLFSAAYGGLFNNEGYNGLWSSTIVAILYVPAALAFLFFRKQKPKE